LSNVSLTIEKGSSGRKPVSEDFPEHAAWAIEKIKQYPSTDPVLALTFKDRPETEEVEESERRQYRKQETRMQAGLTRAMQDAGLRILSASSS